jgi:predicted NBD/HSP70 family sugar kinase
VREQSVVDLLRREGPMSRAAIARRCSISKPTVSNVVANLLEARLLVEAGRDARRHGRPGRLLAFNAAAGFVVGMDVGGTNTRAVLTDLEGAVVTAVREPTARGPADALTRQLAGIVERLAAEAGATDRVVEVAIGTPGVVDQTRRRIAIAPNLPALETDGFLDRLAAAIGAPLTVLNDVNAAALGELRHGAGSGLRDLVFVSVGTGLGLGLVIDGEPHHGIGGRAGELGLLPFPPGAATTLEDALSGAGLRVRHRRAGGSGDLHDAFHEAECGREPGASLITTFLDTLAWALVAVITLLDPERVVLGGGLGLRCAPRLDELRGAVTRAAGFACELHVARLGDDAGLRGAVASALEPARSVPRWLKGGPLARSV